MDGRMMGWETGGRTSGWIREQTGEWEVDGWRGGVEEVEGWS